jgi:hypothetical protein
MSASDLFQSTRHQALLAQLIQRLLQRYQPLADFNDLPGVQANGRTYKGLQVVPLVQIAGSINRKGDFDRQFRPLRKHLRERWVNIFLLMQTDSWEPVTLFKVGESYYVEDGHHRVSVASTCGRQYIEADVWEYVAGKPPCQCKMIKIPARQASVPGYCEECVSA